MSKRRPNRLLVAVAALSSTSITPLKSQTTATDAPAWQIAAGGKMVFEVASVKLSKVPPRPPLFPLDNRDAYLPGGRFSANFELWSYISFAYKLPQNQEQTRAALAKFPKKSRHLRFI